jgi:hypothetical protein
MLAVGVRLPCHRLLGRRSGATSFNGENGRGVERRRLVKLSGSRCAVARRQHWQQHGGGGSAPLTGGRRKGTGFGWATWATAVLVLG